MSKGYIHTRDIEAINLVGGIGERLASLTWYRTKSAVMVGPSILSAFSTSNALNSHIPYLTLASQHRPYSLRKFYANVHGSNFGPGKKIDVITPLDTSNNVLYKGTADAFYNALKIVERRKPKYVLGLSGDHLFRMDFEPLFEMFLDYKPKADFVVITQKVTKDEAHRFGILTLDGTNVTNFKEKPKPGTLPEQEEFDTSTGIYFALFEVWKEILETDQRKRPFPKESDLEKDPQTQTEHDIGRDVIPDMIGKYNLHAFTFDGYWKDVGEPIALYEAYMDIFIKRQPDLFGNSKWKIESIAQPHFHSHKEGERYFTAGRFDVSKSEISDSIFSPGVSGISSELLNSIFLGESQYGTHIEKGSYIDRVIVDKDVRIGENVVLKAPENYLILVSRQTTIPNKTKIEAKNNVIVAHLEEMISNLDNIIGFRKRVSPNVELYLPNGTHISIDELLEKVNKESH